MSRHWPALLVVALLATAARAGEKEGDDLALAIADRMKLALMMRELPWLRRGDLDTLHAEIRSLAAKVAPQGVSAARRKAILEAIEPFVNEHFPQERPDQAYIEFRDQVGTLKWALWLALTRKGLTPEPFAKREEQRTWMRDYIGSLPDHPEFGTQAEELAKLERFFGDPLLPPFQEPMTAEQFAAFRKVFERRKPRHAGHAAGNLRLRAFTIVYPARVLRQTLLPFDERAQDFALSSSRWHMEFESNAGLRPRRLGIEPIEQRKSAILDLARMVVMSSDAGPGEEALAKRLRGLDRGELIYDGAGAALVAIRGTKLALLNVGTWHELDRLTDAELRRTLAERSTTRVPIGRLRFRDPALGPDRPIGFVAIQRPDGGIDAVRVIQWGHTDRLGIETRPRPSSLVRSEPGEEKPPEPEARAEPWTPPKRAYGKVDSFESVSVAIVPHYPGDARKRQIDIRADGAVTYALSGTLAGRKIDHRASFRLTLEHLRELERLLEATGWLTKPGVDKTLRHTHPTEYTVTLTRAGKLHRLNCFDTRQEPYWALFRFFGHLDRQERVLRKLTSGDATERRDAARDLAGKVAATEGRSGTLPPFGGMLDYHRFVPVLAERLAHPDACHPAELDAAVRVIGHVRDAAHWDKLVALDVEHPGPLEQALATTFSRFGGEAAVRALGRLAPDSHAARRALVQLGPEAVPAIVRILQTPPGERSDPAYQLIRTCLDRWRYLPGPLDPRIVAAVGKTTEARRWRGDRHILAYFQQFLRRAATEPPPPGRYLCRITARRAQTTTEPYRLAWRIARFEPIRLIHGWYTVVDGRAVGHHGFVESEPSTDHTTLSFEVALRQGKLTVTVTRTDRRPCEPPRESSTTATITIPPGATLGHARHLDGEGRLPERLETLWELEIVRDGKVVQRVLYAARVARDDEPTPAFEPPREGKPR